MKRYVMVISLVLLLVLSGCDRFNPGQSNPETEDYYRGSEGVIMRFAPGSPPPRMFYYSDESVDQNTFDISVELHNMGASAAYGALYISGFSPDIVDIEGTNMRRRPTGDCLFDFDLSGGTWPPDYFGVFASCDGVQGGINSRGDVTVRATGILEKIGLDKFGIHEVRFDRVGDQYHVDLGWDAVGGNEILNHGHGLAMMLSPLDLALYNGYMFNADITGRNGDGLLMGDNYLFPGGEHTFQNFIGTISPNWPAGLDETDVQFVVTSCYSYATYAAPKVCIDPSPFDETRKVCTPHEYSWSGSQGAPVAITSMKQDPTPRSVFLTFTIRNVGGGEVFNPGYLERCSPYYPGRLDSRHKDVVYVGDVRIGNQRLRCTPGYEVRLNNGVGTFTCEYEMEYETSKTAYETPVVVELWYGYQEQMQTSMYVKRVS